MNEMSWNAGDARPGPGGPGLRFPGPRSCSGGPAAGGPTAARPGWEAGALALREAARRRSMYVIVPDDPLADVAAGWRAMWEVPGGAAGFEERAAEVLAAWRDKRF